MKIRAVTVALYVMPALLVVDWINGLLGHRLGLDRLPVSPGELCRGVVFLAAFFVALLAANRERRSTFGAAVIVGIAVFPGCVLGILTGGGMDELDKLFKILYAPVLISAYAVLFRRYGVQWTTILGAEAVMGAIAGVSIVGFSALGIGFSTYGTYSSANSGLFDAQNDIGLTMSLTLFCGMEMLLRERPALWGTLCAMTIAGMLTVGTRTGAMAAFAVPIAVLWVHRNEFRNRRRLPVMFGIIMLMGLALGAGAVKEYLQLTSEAYQAKKYESLFEGEMPRAILMAGALSYISHRAPYRDVIGDGASQFGRGTARALGIPKQKRTAEVDWVDIFGQYGLIGVMTVYAYYLWFYRRILKLRKIVGWNTMWLGLGFLSFFLLHASVAGHAMESPLPAGAIASVFAFFWTLTRKDTPFRGMNAAPLAAPLEPVPAGHDASSG